MQEITQGLNAVYSVIASLLFSLCYMFGGRDVAFLGIRARLWKRLIAPLLLASSAVIFSILAHKLSWWLFVTALWFIPIGYSGEKHPNSLLYKAFRRLIQSLFFTVPGLILGIFVGNWQIATVQCILGAFITVILGSLNPVEAAEEEALIAFFNTCLMGMIIL